MPVYSNKKVAAFAADSAPGVYGTPVAPKFPINDLEIAQPDLGISEYGRPANGTMARGKFLSGAQSIKFGFTSFMNPLSATVGSEFRAKELFMMCGWRYRTVTTGGHTYAEVFMDANPTCETYSLQVTNLGCYDSSDTTPAGEQWKIRGAKGSLTIAAEKVGAPLLLTVSVTGAVEDYIENADAIDTSTLVDFSSIEQDRFLGATVSLNGVDLDVQSFTATDGNTIAMINDAGSAGGVKLAYVGDTAPKVTPVSIVGTSTSGLWDKTATNQNVGDLVITGQFYTYTFSDCMVSAYSHADASGILVLNLELTPLTTVAIRSIAHIS